MDNQDIVRTYIEAINEKNLLQMASLTHEDIKFTDPSGWEAEGRLVLSESMAGYYAMFPDYKVSVQASHLRDDVILVECVTTGSLSDIGRQEIEAQGGEVPPDDQMQGPAIWEFTIKDEIIMNWRMFLDTPEVRKEFKL